MYSNKMQHFRNLRFVLIKGSLPLLVLIACYLGLESNHYRHRLCTHVQQALQLTTLTVLAQREIWEDEEQEREDVREQAAWQAEARKHFDQAYYDLQWAHVLHNTSLELQAQATYVSTVVVPAVQEVFATTTPLHVQKRWCQVTLLHTVCHFFSAMVSLTDSPTNVVEQQQHSTMLDRTPQETETWVLEVLSNQTTAYEESAHTVDEYVSSLQQKATMELNFADLELKRVHELQDDEDALHNRTVQLEHDMQQNTATRNAIWKQAIHEGWIAYGTGIVSLCLAIVGVVGCGCWAVAVSMTTPAVWPHSETHSDPYAILRRCLIAWCVTGVVNELATPTGGTSRLYSGLTSHDRAQPVDWIFGLAVTIGFAQAILLHDFSHLTTCWGRHVRNLLLDGAKFSGVSVLHVLTIWLIGAGHVPGNVATNLLNTTTQIVLVGAYVLVLVWEPPVFPTGEATTVLTGESDESTPLQGAQPPRYLEDDHDEDASPAVMYLRGSTSSGGGSSGVAKPGCSYTTAADAGFVASWNVWLLVCLVRDIGMVAPCVQLHPFSSGFVLGTCLVTSFVVACQWLCWQLPEHEDGLPRTIVV